MDEHEGERAGEHILVRPDLREGMTEEERAEAIRRAADEMWRGMAAQAGGDGAGDRSARDGGSQPTGFRVNAGFIAWKTSIESAFARECFQILEGAVERRERSLAMWMERLIGPEPGGRERLEKELEADAARKEKVKKEFARREADIEKAKARLERGRKIYERANRAWLRAHVISHSMPRFDDRARKLAAEQFHMAVEAAEEISLFTGHRSGRWRPRRKRAKGGQ